MATTVGSSPVGISVGPGIVSDELQLVRNMITKTKERRQETLWTDMMKAGDQFS
jgi:hypothetical protein